LANPKKLSGAERKTAIVRAVRHLFAMKGFAGTTTRELADAAGVSEALLYRHFPTKEDLYVAIHQSLIEERNPQQLKQLTALEPSTTTLVLLVHFLVVILARDASDPGEGSIPMRLILRSLTEDGEFSQIIGRQLTCDWAAKVEECLHAAAKAGEAIEQRVPFNVGCQFAFHLASMVMMQFLPGIPMAAYLDPKSELVGKIVWFALRGMGLHEDAIERYYKPETLMVLGL